MPGMTTSVITGVFAMLLALHVGLLHAQQPATARQMFDGAMLPDVEVETFEHMDALSPVKVVRRAGAVHRLPAAAAQPLATLRFQSHGNSYDLFDYLADNRVAGLLILKDGKVVLEDYELGASAQTRWASFSMAKSVTSTLVGVALQQGLIASLDDSVTRYVPALKGGVYEQVSVRNVLQMASGVRWDETYTDPRSDRRKLLEVQLTHMPGGVLGYMNALPRAASAGTLWNYSTGETFVLGAVVEGATHMSLADYLSQNIWSRLGMEQDAIWWTESRGGMGLGGAGISATLRDYGRFALMVQQDGIIDGKSLVPPGWFRDAGSAHVIGGKSVDYGYQWWPLPAGNPLHQGAFQAIGIFGQHLYINPAHKLVIVVLSARSKPSANSTTVEDADFFAAVAAALQ
jgi:CubicO group peptidase (beta-lactamase class C family)